MVLLQAFFLPLEVVDGKKSAIHTWYYARPNSQANYKFLAAYNHL